ncbi:translation initiation factor IF-2-like isoform X2 [Meles meles]|uniref:translation initiation factor IF-2-like isoform X1 n=1 Tax=Meles meles TaxID=9662 RepID=UPI001E69D914|nr:translation initiation factor IF-2-like isoform X1 [Meles meles]XP_045883176.1 translation initiation factor IF-2-like isoform X2 [Meles meles]
MIGTSAPVAWTACLPAGPAPAPASTASKARGFVVNGKATDPGPARALRANSGSRQSYGRSRRSFWSRQGRRQQGASPPHPAFWEPQPCVCPSGSPGGQAASSGLPPSSELPGSPSEAGAHRHPLGEAGPGRRRGSSWRACQTAHGPAGTGPRSQRSPWVSLPPRASRPEVPASAGPSGTRLPGRRGGTFCTGWALQSKGDVRRPEGISFSEQKGRRPLSPSCGCGLALGALAGVRTAKRGLRRLEGRTLPGAGVAFARKCRRTGFEGRRDQLGRRWEGLGMQAGRPPHSTAPHTQHLTCLPS